MDENQRILIAMYSMAEIDKYVYNYLPDGIILDTNILLLLLIGVYDQERIKQCGLTSKYEKNDFNLLLEIIKRFKKIIITPYILAEVSNHSKNELKGSLLQAYFQAVINQLKTAEERNIELSSLIKIQIKYISDFGFTDMAIHELLIKNNDKIAVLTNDGRFHAFLSSSKIPAIKFDHIKTAGMLG